MTASRPNMPLSDLRLAVNLFAARVSSGRQARLYVVQVDFPFGPALAFIDPDDMLCAAHESGFWVSGLMRTGGLRWPCEPWHLLVPPTQYAAEVWEAFDAPWSDR